MPFICDFVATNEIASLKASEFFSFHHVNLFHGLHSSFFGAMVLGDIFQ